MTYDKSKVSPRPWTYDGDNILDANKSTVYNDERDDAYLNYLDCPHIVHCVNMHDELVDVLTALVQVIAEEGFITDVSPEFQAADTLLARAEGQL